METFKLYQFSIDHCTVQNSFLSLSLFSQMAQKPVKFSASYTSDTEDANINGNTYCT